MCVPKMTSCDEIVNVQLVREVEKHPILYNYKLPEYSKRELVEAAWNEIAEVMNDEAINCKEKWRNLRTVFVRKLKPLPAGVVRRKSYYLGEVMSFLTPYIKVQKSDDFAESVVSPLQSESENVAFSEEPEQNECEEGDSSDKVNNAMEPGGQSYQAGSEAKRRAFESREFGGAIIPEYVESKRCRNLESDESRKYFLLSLLPEIQKLTDNQMKFFRRKVLDALDEAEAFPPYSRPVAMFSEDNTQNVNGGRYFEEFSPKREC